MCFQSAPACGSYSIYIVHCIGMRTCVQCTMYIEMNCGVRVSSFSATRAMPASHNGALRMQNVKANCHIFLDNFYNRHSTLPKCRHFSTFRHYSTFRQCRHFRLDTTRLDIFRHVEPHATHQTNRHCQSS